MCASMLQVLAEYDDHNVPGYLSNLKSSQRQFLSTVGGSSVFKKLSNDYDAFDEDIAMVQVFFEPSAVFLFGSDPSQTWCHYYKTFFDFEAFTTL